MLSKSAHPLTSPTWLSSAALFLMAAVLVSGCLAATDEEARPIGSAKICGTFKGKAATYAVFLNSNCTDGRGNVAPVNNDSPWGNERLLFQVSAGDLDADGRACQYVPYYQVEQAKFQNCKDRGFVPQPAIGVAVVDPTNSNALDTQFCATASLDESNYEIDFVSDPSQDSVMEWTKPSTYCPAWKTVGG